MTDANIQAAAMPAEAASDSTAASTSPLVTFDNAAATSPADQALTPLSEWAFAAHEKLATGEAIDALRGPQESEVSPIIAAPVIAAATMAIAAEADMFVAASDALVSTAPAASDDAFALTTDEAGPPMWSAASAAETPDAVEHVTAPMLASHDIAAHGMGLDWTHFSLPGLS